jgi:hypothetical protein
MPKDPLGIIIGALIPRPDVEHNICCNAREQFRANNNEEDEEDVIAREELLLCPRFE